jgi:hypothetical protein
MCTETLINIVKLSRIRFYALIRTNYRPQLP